MKDIKITLRKEILKLVDNQSISEKAMNQSIDFLISQTINTAVEEYKEKQDNGRH